VSGNFCANPTGARSDAKPLKLFGPRRRKIAQARNPDTTWQAPIISAQRTTRGPTAQYSSASMIVMTRSVTDESLGSDE
jgi:hypothetical protein